LDADTSMQILVMENFVLPDGEMSCLILEYSHLFVFLALNPIVVVLVFSQPSSGL